CPGASADRDRCASSACRDERASDSYRGRGAWGVGLGLEERFLETTYQPANRSSNLLLAVNHQLKQISLRHCADACCAMSRASGAAIRGHEADFVQAAEAVVLDAASMSKRDEPSCRRSR